MIYNVKTRKKFRYTKTYKISKKINDNTNPISRAMQYIVDRYIVKKEKSE